MFLYCFAEFIAFGIALAALMFCVAIYYFLLVFSSTTKAREEAAFEAAAVPSTEGGGRRRQASLPQNFAVLPSHFMDAVGVQVQTDTGDCDTTSVPVKHGRCNCFHRTRHSYTCSPSDKPAQASRNAVMGAVQVIGHLL